MGNSPAVEICKVDKLNIDIIGQFYSPSVAPHEVLFSLVLAPQSFHSLSGPALLKILVVTAKKIDLFCMYQGTA